MDLHWICTNGLNRLLITLLIKRLRVVITTKIVVTLSQSKGEYYHASTSSGQTTHGSTGSP
jgi:hypothetical protein